MAVARLFAVAAIAFLVGCGAGADREEVKAAVRSALAAKSHPRYVTADQEGRRLWKLTRQFYERREHTPAWIKGTKPTGHIDQLVSALHGAVDEGLDPQLYSVDVVEQRLQEGRQGFLTAKGFNPADAGALDVWLTYLYLKYASDLGDGLSDLAHADPRWHIKPEKLDPGAHLEQALQRNTVAASLLELVPDHPEYRALRKTLAHYRTAAAKGPWPVLPAKLKLEPGKRSAHVPALAARLSATGDYTGRIPSGARDAVYTPELADAVKHFQRRHGLADDGVIGAAVIAEMNVPIHTRIRQIQLNLERWRWLPRSLGDRHIVVNIPEYRLEVREGGQIPLRMRVVVGKADTPTPIFDDEMTYLVFSPYWNVPPEIAQGETLPEVLKDPAFLERSNMEVVSTTGEPMDPAALDLMDPASYRFRQRPGSANALGLVKFMFPNQHNVYLHDTPTGALFARVTRSFSHGCVRLEEPIALAEYVLRDKPQWTRDRIEQAMQAGEERVVKLAAPIPVYLVYWTVRVSGEGVVHFRRDVYGIDGEQMTRLGQRLARLRKAAAAAGGAAVAPATPAGARSVSSPW